MPNRRPHFILTALGALLALTIGCAPPTASVPEAEPDAAVDATPPEPGCPYAPNPLGPCGEPTAPPPACVLEVEGPVDPYSYARSGALLFDAAGRWAGYRDEPGRSNLWVFDIENDWRAADAYITEDGCALCEETYERTPTGWVSHDRGPNGDSCTLVIESGGGVASKTRDPGCDCRDVETLIDCALGPHGRSRCVSLDRPGVISRFEHDAAGRLVSRTLDGPSSPGVERSWRFDAEGRVTVRRDSGDDGRAEWVQRDTYDADDRLVLRETGDDDGLPHRVETAYGADGGWRRVTRVQGEVRQIETWDVTPRRTVLTTESAGGRTVDTSALDDQGRLIERTLEESAPDGDPIRTRHRVIARDLRGLITEQRSREVRAGQDPVTCTLRYRWSGPCPTPPDDVIEDCVRFAPLPPH